MHGAQPGSEGGSCQPEGGHRGTERDLGKDAKCNPSSSGGPEKAGIWCEANQGETESVQTIPEAYKDISDVQEKKKQEIEQKPRVWSAGLFVHSYACNTVCRHRCLQLWKNALH